MQRTAAVAFFVIAALFVLGGCASLRSEKANPPIGEFVEVDGARIHLVDIGPRDSVEAPVVLIHGASVNLRDMKLALGDALSKTRRVIIVDRPGRGYSTRPDDGWRLDRQAALIHDAVKRIGVERSIIVGQSFGGAVALSYALHHPDDISGLKASPIFPARVFTSPRTAKKRLAQLMAMLKNESLMAQPNLPFAYSLRKRQAGLNSGLRACKAADQQKAKGGSDKRDGARVERWSRYPSRALH